MLGAFISGFIAYVLTGDKYVLIYLFVLVVSSFVMKILRSLNG